MKPVLYDSHVHTALCQHAAGTGREYAEVALRRGLKGMIFTDHSPMPGGYAGGVRMAENELDEYLGMIEQVRQMYAGRVDVRRGLECEYFPGIEPVVAKLLEKARWDYIMGSVHCTFVEYQRLYAPGDAVAFQRTYFEHLAEAAETGLYDALAHADIVKNVTFEDWQLMRIMDDVRRCLDRIAATGVALELNTSGVHKPAAETMPGVSFVSEMHARGIPVVLASDAHAPERVGELFEEALDLLAEVGYGQISFFLERQRQTVLIADGRASLGARTI